MADSENGPIQATLSKPPQITAIDQEIAGYGSVTKKEASKNILTYDNSGILGPELQEMLHRLEASARAQVYLAARRGQNIDYNKTLEAMKSNNFVSPSYYDFRDHTEYRFVATFEWVNLLDQTFPENVPIPGNGITYEVGETETNMSNFAAELGIEVSGGVNVGFASVSTKVSAKMSASFGREFAFNKRQTTNYTLPVFTPTEDTRILIWQRDSLYTLQFRVVDLEPYSGEWMDVPDVEPLRDDTQKIAYQIFPKP